MPAKEQAVRYARQDRVTHSLLHVLGNESTPCHTAWLVRSQLQDSQLQPFFNHNSSLNNFTRYNDAGNNNNKTKRWVRLCPPTDTVAQRRKHLTSR